MFTRAQTMHIQEYDIALTALQASNNHLERKMEQLHSSTLSLRKELLTLQMHILSFRHDQLVTWQADILTRLIEVIYERQGRKLPWDALGDDKQREDISKVYVAAARRINKGALWRKLGLTAKHHKALGRYSEVSQEKLLGAQGLCFQPVVVGQRMADQCMHEPTGGLIGWFSVFYIGCRFSEYGSKSYRDRFCAVLGFGERESPSNVRFLGKAISDLLREIRGGECPDRIESEV